MIVVLTVALYCLLDYVMWIISHVIGIPCFEYKISPRHDNVSQCFCCLFSDRRFCKLSLFTFETINYSRELSVMNPRVVDNLCACSFIHSFKNTPTIKNLTVGWTTSPPLGKSN